MRRWLALPFCDKLQVLNAKLQGEYKRNDASERMTYSVRMVSLIHPSSSVSVTSQLDLFTVPPTQTSIEDGFFTEYRPISVLTSGGPVEFCIAAESSNYIDLANTFLYVRALVTKADGTALAADTKITPKCNFLHTL